MTRTYLDLPCPIAALATPSGPSALAVIKTAGPGSIECASRCFSRPGALIAAPGYSLVHGFLVDPATRERIDEVMVSVFRAPHSHTGEDSVELSCHGSPEVVRRVLRALEDAGFAPALPGEFSLRALINGKIDLVRAEAVEELVHARGERARTEALARLEGGLSRRVAAIRSDLLDLLAGVEVRLDYPEDEGPEGSAPGRAAIEALLQSVQKLATTYRLGRLHRDGARVVIAGRPNAGKSSLFNLLLREERSIVSPEPGTTRDWIEAWIEIDGMAVRLMDTAGIRDSGSSVEAAGVERARDLIARADVVVYMVDGTAGPDSGDTEFIAGNPAAILLWNKVDSPDCQSALPGFIPASTTTAAGFQEFIEALRMAIAGESGPDAEAEILVAGERQKILLDRTASALVQARDDSLAGENLDILALDLREAAFHLGEMTGEILSGEILEAVFSRFCLGK